MSKPRQVVVVIHGIGEQRPMDTLRSFVMGVLGPAAGAGGDPRFFNKPDLNADGFELRRIRAFDRRHDTDFVEFYWQHLMPIAASRFLTNWVWTLMQRPSREMPPRFRFLWWLSWIAVLFGVALAMIAFANVIARRPVASSGLPELSGILVLMLGSVWGIVKAYVGDAAIYLNPHPRTVEARNAIRGAGVALLDRLHQDSRYQRIVVVGHSLGSVIAYDILRFAWNRKATEWRDRVVDGQLQPTRPPLPRLEASEDLAAESAEAIRQGWHAAAKGNFDEHEALGLGWKVTDLITAGSPLAHSDLLLAANRDDLVRRQQERELPTAPPYRDDGRHFSFKLPIRDGKNTPLPPIVDHAALFALTTWTNLYFPCRHLLYGDPIGGPVAPLFGPGVRDREVRTSIWRGRLTHTFYWTRDGDWNGPGGAVGTLIEALDLNRFAFPEAASAAKADAAAPPSTAAPAPEPAQPAKKGKSGSASGRRGQASAGP